MGFLQPGGKGPYLFQVAGAERLLGTELPVLLKADRLAGLHLLESPHRLHLQKFIAGVGFVGYVVVWIGRGAVMDIAFDKGRPVQQISGPAMFVVVAQLKGSLGVGVLL